METIIRGCAGLDEHKASVVACARMIDENGELRSSTHRILVGELLAHLEYLDESIERLSGDIATMIAPFARAIDLRSTTGYFHSSGEA